MGFSCKVWLSSFRKSDGTRQVKLVAYIDRQRADISLGFCVDEKSFDARRQRMKASHPNAQDFDAEIMSAVARANSIASKYRVARKTLTPTEFIEQYKEPTEEMDFLKFFRSALELKRPTLASNTCKSHETVLEKLRLFRQGKLPFNQITRELIQKFRNRLTLDGNGNATIEKTMKIVKHYLNEARLQGIAVNDIEIKIKTFRSNRSALTEQEVLRLDEYFRSKKCPSNHQKVLRYFLFSCYTGVRVSDIQELTWKNVHDDMLVYIPVKTKFKNEEVKVPLLDVDKKYLPEFTHENARIFNTFTDQVNNRLLKAIADECGIKKKVTFHTSRHTFGSMMTEEGDVVATQRMMGHGDIKTTMGYVHTNVKQLITAKKRRFDKTNATLPVNET